MKSMVRTNGSEVRRQGWFGLLLHHGRREDGGSIVEMAMVFVVYIPILFGIFEISYGLFVYNYVCNSSRQAARYAAVRGWNSCTIASTFVDCDVNPTGSTNSTPASTSGSTTLQNYLVNMRPPGIDPSKVTVTATWMTETFAGASGFSVASWSACTTTDNATTPCNLPGYAVQVQVTYNFPLNIPFWGQKTLPITGVSQMMIDE